MWKTTEESVQEGGGGPLCQNWLTGQVRWRLKTIIFSNDVDVGGPEESNSSGVRWVMVVLSRMSLREEQRRKIRDSKNIPHFTTKGSKEMGWLLEEESSIKEVCFCFKVRRNNIVFVCWWNWSAKNEILIIWQRVKQLPLMSLSRDRR